MKKIDTKYPHCVDAILDDVECRGCLKIVKSGKPNDWAEYDITFTYGGLFWYKGHEPMTGDIACVISNVISEHYSDYEEYVRNAL